MNDYERFIGLRRDRIKANRKKAALVPGIALGAVLALLGFLAIVAAIVMLLLGVVHQSWPAVPALGFWASLALLLLTRLLFTTSTGFNIKSES